MLDLNRPKRRPLVRPPLAITRRLHFREFKGRSDKRGCEGRLRSSTCSKILSN
jgi:hypothetical protein